ncbi:MAG TPA: M48 family metallopeptidase [Candidatus Nanoarchaeia archaeon]|nr:M48 family metallopeptidase [Candidatus Nanoarchaeia archaeon]
MRINCQIKKSRRAKNICLRVSNDATAVLTIPWRVSREAGLRFLRSKQGWLIHQIKIKKEKIKNTPVRTRADYLSNKRRAERLVWGRLEHFNSFYNFSYNRVTIRDQQSRWGSCSAKKNLNFSYRIVFLPQELADYLIVHELCHLGEMNHSARFWALVAKTIPNYKVLRRILLKDGNKF